MMEQRNVPLIFFFICSFFLLLSLSRSVEAYKNYTVGDSLGWYDNLQKPEVNYQKWVSGKEFSLGDFLIFNTDSNHSVVQTYNATTYKRCDYDNADDDDTTEWSGADPSSTAPVPVTVPVPLMKEGTIYFFSGDYDGDQCKHGQHFKINVVHGQGLPPSLKNPSEESSPAPTKSASSGSDNDDSEEDDSSTPTPDTVVSSNFNHPKQSSTDSAKETSGSVSSSNGLSFSAMNLVGMMLVLLVVRDSLDRSSFSFP